MDQVHWHPNRTEEERQDRHSGNKALINEWRKQVYQRDNFICQHCKKKSEHDLVAHHLNGFDNFINYSPLIILKSFYTPLICAAGTYLRIVSRNSSISSLFGDVNPPFGTVSLCTNC